MLHLVSGFRKRVGLRHPGRSKHGHEKLSEKIKAGTLQIDECNNCEAEVNGRKVYGFVVTGIKGWDPVALAIGGYLVDGYAYWFVSKANRDNLFKYLSGSSKKSMSSQAVTQLEPTLDSAHVGVVVDDSIWSSGCYPSSTTNAQRDQPVYENEMACYHHALSAHEGLYMRAVGSPLGCYMNEGVECNHKEHSRI